MTTQDIRSIVIIGREFWNSSAGHTNYSSVALVDGKVEAVIEYGSGSNHQYEQDIWDILIDKLSLDVERYANWNGVEQPHRYCSRKGINFYSTVAYVARRKDL